MKASSRVAAAAPAEINAAFDGNLKRVGEMVFCGRVTIAGTTEFTVRHALGARPDFYHYVPFSDIRIYAEESSQRKWNRELIALRSSGAGVILLWTGRLNGETI